MSDIFVGMTKALNSISHEILLSKLMKIIGQNNLWFWFNSMDLGL